MVDRQEIINYLRLNKSRLQQKYHVVRIGVFGSFAREEQSEQSDIDIILEFEDNTDNLSQIKDDIRDEIQVKFKRPVDICREKYIKPIFREQILSQALYA